jgi:hypothetical protein
MGGSFASSWQGLGAYLYISNMRFLTPSADYDEIGKNCQAYRAYLESVRGNLPPGVYEFAVADWHYDPAHHWTLHDPWVQSIAIRETAADANSQRQCHSCVIWERIMMVKRLSSIIGLPRTTGSFTS